MKQYDELRDMIDTDTDECIIWPYGRNGKGYGKLEVAGKTRNAHRLALELAKGVPPHPSMQACHGPCRNRACINPKHLSWQTSQQNSLDKHRDGTMVANGAKLSPEQVSEVRERYAAGGVSQKALAAEYGISQNGISNIVHHRAYTMAVPVFSINLLDDSQEPVRYEGVVKPLAA